MCYKKLLLLALISLSHLGCGDDESPGSDDGTTANKKTIEEIAAIPSDFKNTASTPTELNTSVTQVSTDTSATQNNLGLGAGSLPNQLLRSAQAGSSYIADFEFVTTELEEGGDCSSFFTGLKSMGSEFSSLFSQVGSTTYLEDDFSVDESKAPANSEFGTVEEKDDRFAYHIQLISSLGETFVTTMDFGAGATDKTVATFMNSTVVIDASAASQGAEGQQSSDTKITVATNMEVYANTEEKTVSFSSVSNTTVTGSQGGDADISIAIQMDLDGDEENPSIKQTITSSGTAGAEDFSGEMTFEMKRVESNVQVTYAGNFGGTQFDKKIVASKTGTTCKIESIE